MSKTRTHLIRLVPLLALCMLGAWQLEEYDTGILGVLSYISYFGQAICAIAIVAVLTRAGVRKVRGGRAVAG